MKYNVAGASIVVSLTALIVVFPEYAALSAVAIFGIATLAVVSLIVGELIKSIVEGEDQ